MVLPSDYLKKGWTQHANARNALSIAVEVGDEAATSWCLIGAIYASEYDGRLSDSTREDLRAAVYDILDYTSMSEFNDNPATTQEEVVAIMEQAEATCGLTRKDECDGDHVG